MALRGVYKITGIVDNPVTQQNSITPLEVENLLSVDLDPDPLLDPGHEHSPGDAARLVVQLAQVQVCLVLLQQQLCPGVRGAGVQSEKK